jgi:2-keto-4-pentenoate hydratase/2-oxohepta-3-ene-1,7-dioic acid hydratase in catechol pathway
MKLANIKLNGGWRVALVVDDELVDLTAQLGEDVDDALKFLELGEEGRAIAEKLSKSAMPRLAMDSVRFGSPVLRADKVLGVGMNYHSFVAAARHIGMPIPPDPIWFLRPRGCISGPYDDIWLPRDANDLDYEVELAVIIGQRCRYVSSANAASVIAGFSVANDLTLRKRVSKSLVLAKSFDTHTPLGPWLVTPEEIENPHNLSVRAWVNGKLRQSSSTADMITGCYELVAEISSACTLNPGDIILTGTPDGCGVFEHPPTGLAAGALVKMEIEAIGVIENRIVHEPSV